MEEKEPAARGEAGPPNTHMSAPCGSTEPRVSMQKKNTSRKEVRQSLRVPSPGTTASDRVVRTPESDGGRPVSRFAKEPGSRSFPATGSPPLKVLGEGVRRVRGEQSEPRAAVRFDDSVPPSGDNLTQAWQDLLGRWRWDWFATLTFRGDAVHPEAADKRFRTWISKINRSLYGPRWSKQGTGVRWVRALELQRRGVIHFHALLGGDGLSDLRRLSWMDAWDELAGWARIEPPRSSEAVRAYCAKYVVKGGEIDLGGPLQDTGVLELWPDGTPRDLPNTDPGPTRIRGPPATGNAPNRSGGRKR